MATSNAEKLNIETDGLQSGQEEMAPEKDRAKGRKEAARNGGKVFKSRDLYIASPGRSIGKEGERIIVREKKQVIAEVFGAHLEEITLASRGISLSTDVIRFCSERDIAIHFTDERGRIFSLLQNPESRRNEIAMLQAAHREDEVGLELARMFIFGKVKNQLALLKYYGKYNPEKRKAFLEAFDGHYKGMKELAAKIKNLDICAPRDFRNSLLGLEGAFAARYWQTARQLLPERYAFDGRCHQNAADPVNVALNYGYGILYARIHTALIRAGLNPSCGFLHVDTPGKPVLSWDLIEIFRAPVVDRAVFSALNRLMSFEFGIDGLLTEASRKRVAGIVLARLESTESWRSRQDTLQNHLQSQCEAIVAHLRGQTPFRPFLARW